MKSKQLLRKNFVSTLWQTVLWTVYLQGVIFVKDWDCLPPPNFKIINTLRYMRTTCYYKGKKNLSCIDRIRGAWSSYMYGKLSLRLGFFNRLQCIWLWACHSSLWNNSWNKSWCREVWRTIKKHYRMQNYDVIIFKNGCTINCAIKIIIVAGITIIPNIVW